MAILGLILVVVSIGAGAELALSNRTEVGGEAFGYAATSATPMAFLLAGALLALVAALGLLLITGGLARRRRRRRAATHLVAASEATSEDLLAENRRLRDELAGERRERAAFGDVAVPPRAVLPGAVDPPYGDQVSAVRPTTIAETGRYEPYPDDSRPAARVDTELTSPRHARRH